MTTITTTRPLVLVEAICATCGVTHTRADELMYEALEERHTWRPHLTLRLWHQELYADLRICEDTDLWIRLAARYTLECVEEPLILYRQHGGNIHRDYGNLLQQNLRMLRKTFADPALPPHARRLRKRSFSRLYLMVSGCYVEQGNWWAGVRCALKATAYHLPSAAYVLGFPLRRLSQWINGSMRTSCPRQ